MFRVVNEEKVLVAEAEPRVTMVATESAVRMGLRNFAGGASYVRATRVIVGDRVLPITDYLMVVRLATAALVLIATAWRIIRD